MLGSVMGEKGASGKEPMMCLDIQSDVSISDQQLMDARVKKNVDCDEDGEGCSYSVTVEGGPVSTTNRGRHRQDNDGTLLRLLIMSDVSVADRQVTASHTKRNHKRSQEGKEADEEASQHIQKGKGTDDLDADREEETDEQGHTRPPASKRTRYHNKCPHDRWKYY